MPTVSAPPPFGYLFAGIAVADLAAEVDWFSRLFGRPPDILPNTDEAMWRATGSGSVYLVHRPGRAGHGHLALAVDDLDRWISELAARGIKAVRVETVPAGRKLVLADPEGNEIALAEVPSLDDRIYRFARAIAFAAATASRFVNDPAGPRTWKVRLPSRQVIVLACPPPAATAACTPGARAMRRFRVQT
jgi:catechol 2,3-dioxygenase-like lactoylglutathione lyase family enzyme